MTSSTHPSARSSRLETAVFGPRDEESRLEGKREPLTVAYAEALQNGRTLSIGPEIEEQLGYTQTEWMADPLLGVRIMHPDDRDRVLEDCLEANQTRRPFRAEYRMIARDGRVVRVLDHAVLVFGSHGQPLCWQGTMVEVLDD
jgi:PAS domain S-box-containing protein